MKNYHKNNESSYLKSWNGNLYGWAMLEKFPVNKSEQIKDTCQFD